MAALSSAMPSILVYLLSPRSIALMAARLMLSGVSKSGSPAPSPMTLRPAALSARALSVTAMVAEGLMRLSESARKAMDVSNRGGSPRPRAFSEKCQPHEGAVQRSRKAGATPTDSPPGKRGAAGPRAPATRSCSGRHHRDKKCCNATAAHDKYLSAEFVIACARRFTYVAPRII